MAILMRRSSYGNYAKMEKEDAEEKKHKEAQFLIYRTMKQADQVAMMRRSNWLKLRISKLKVRIGKRFLRLRKTVFSNISKSKVGVYKHVMTHLKSLKGLFHSNTTTSNFGRTLPQPIFS